MEVDEYFAEEEQGHSHVVVVKVLQFDFLAREKLGNWCIFDFSINFQYFAPEDPSENDIYFAEKKQRYFFVLPTTLWLLSENFRHFPVKEKLESRCIFVYLRNFADFYSYWRENQSENHQYFVFEKERDPNVLHITFSFGSDYFQ